MRSPLQLHTKTSGYSGSLVSLAIILISVLVAGWLLLNRQYVIDQVTVWQYHPSSDVQTIGNKAQLSSHGRFYFYASQPEVDNADAFNKQCKKQEEHSAILGCYSNRRIYVYNVTNQQIDGVKEVTAAHEMLHAAWDRLSDSEKQRLKQLLTAQYNKVATAELEQRMAYYERTQPGESINELHSILGTEIVNLDEGLEQYYARYFTDRKQVATLHQHYQQVFNDLDVKEKKLRGELQQLESDIKAQLASYDSRRVTLEQQNGDLQTQSVDRSDPAAVRAYNAQVTEFNSALVVLKTDYVRITSLIETYNQKFTEYRGVAFSQSSLEKSIDSSQAPVAPAI